MRKTLFYTFIILISAGLLIYFYTANKGKQTEPKLESFQIQNQPQYVKPKEFDDGLENPEKIETFDWGTRSDGVVEIRTYMFDINGDKLKDKITKTRYENGTRLGFWDYKIEIATGSAWKDITPDGLNTAEDVDCDLQRIQFSFLPFKIKKVWREIETDWDMPSIAFIVNYELKNGVLVGTQPRKANVVCDVKVLF
ncbi:MAG: hypothetical protein ACOX7D_02800 [Alphaproteobacteria bacterium]|jgi:hypothetical protein